MLSRLATLPQGTTTVTVSSGDVQNSLPLLVATLVPGLVAPVMSTGSVVASVMSCTAEAGPTISTVGGTAITRPTT